MQKRWKAGKDANGGLTIKDQQGFDEYLATLKGELAVTVSPWRQTTSNPQFAYYYAVPVKLIADMTGFTKDEVDVYLRTRFLSLMHTVPAKGDQFIMVRKVLSKTSVNTTQFEEFLTDVRRWALADLGVVIPLPNEVSYLQ